MRSLATYPLNKAAMHYSTGLLVLYTDLMPARASRQQLATHVGRVVFQSRATTKAIARKLESLPGDKLKSALERRGLKEVSVKKLSEVLSGKDRASLSRQDLKQAVEALQEVGVAKKELTARQMVQTANEEIQKGRGLKSLEPGLRFQKNINDLNAQRALEEDMLRREGRGESKGILDTLRGVSGAMQQANRDGQASTRAMERLTSNPEQHVSEQDRGGIRGLRHSIRRVLGMQTSSPINSSVALPRANDDHGLDLPQNPKGYV